MKELRIFKWKKKQKKKKKTNLGKNKTNYISAETDLLKTKPLTNN